MRVSHHVIGLSVAVTFLLALGATPARADDSAAAREHYQKGTSFYDLGKYPEAIKEFEAAYEIKNDPALLYNLAQSNRLAGNTDQALHFYRTYLRYVPTAKNRAEIEDRIKQLEQLAAQKTATQTAPPNQTIPPPTGPATTTPPPTTTTPPPPPLETAPPPPPPGAPPADTTYAPPMVATTAPPPPPAIDHHKMILAGKITAIAGGGLFLIGAAFGGAAVGAANEVNSEASSGKAFDPSVESRGKNFQAAETAFMITGALVAATGGVLYFYGRHLTTAESASVAPVATSTGGAGVSLRVIF